jgi:hypothetical protein
MKKLRDNYNVDEIDLLDGADTVAEKERALI